MPGRRLVLVTDSGLSALEFWVALLRQEVTCVTRPRLDAALYQPAPPRQPSTIERPRTKGARRPTLAEVLADKTTRWQRLTVPGWYGEGDRVVEICSDTAVGVTAACRSCRSARCCCATPAAASNHRRCSGQTRRRSRCRSSAGSPSAGSWKLACPPKTSPLAVRSRCDHGRGGHGREAEHAGADHRQAPSGGGAGGSGQVGCRSGAVDRGLGADMA